jgi:transposase
MNLVSTLGIELAKNTFSVHGVSNTGEVVLRRTVPRAKLVELVAQLSPCLIGMEACSGAHEWARQFGRFGHSVKLMAPKFVAPYRKSGKNDGNDAEAICEAVTRPNMRFVPVKSVEQQADLGLHRVRQGFVEERTGTLNRIRGLPARIARCVRDLLEHAERLGAKMLECEQEIRLAVRDNELARRAQIRQGIGPITASALVLRPAPNRCLTNEARARGLHAGQSAEPLTRGRLELRGLSFCSTRRARRTGNQKESLTRRRSP